MSIKKSFKLSSSRLSLEFDLKHAAFDVRQKRSGCLWRMERHDCQDLSVVRFGREKLLLSLSDARQKQFCLLSDHEARVEFSDFKGVNSSLSVTLVMGLKDAELELEISVNDADPDIQFESLYYPRSFLLPNSRDAYWLNCKGGGSLIPGDHREVSDQSLGWKPSLKCHGGVIKKSAFLCLWETPWDTYHSIKNDPSSGPRSYTRHLASLGRFGCNRRLRFVFRENSGYVDLIRNVYRPWAIKRGYYRTLEEKTRENPRIKNLAGGAIFHQLIAYVDRRNLERRWVTFDHAEKVFTRIVRETGIRKGCYHLDGWCRQGYDALHPDVFPPYEPAGGEKGMMSLSQTVKKLGFHFGLHDNYLLFFPDAERYRDRHAVWGPDLEPYRDQFRAGGLNMVQSPSAAREFIIANYLTGQNIFRRRWKPAGKAYNLEFCYLDQYMISGGGVEEDFNPSHPLTREQFVAGMMENIRIMREQVGCITSSEHMYDFCVPLYDVNGNNEGLAPTDPKAGIIPAPLWNLAFHECLVVTDATIDARNFAKCAWIGGLLHYRPDLYYQTDDKVQMAIQMIRDAAPIRALHEEVMYRECTGSRLLSPDGNRQEIDYGDITVAVDLANSRVEISGSDGADGKFDFSGVALNGSGMEDVPGKKRPRKTVA